MRYRTPSRTVLLVLPFLLRASFLTAEVKPLTKESAEQAIKKGETLKNAEGFCKSFDGIRTRVANSALMAYSISIETPTCGVALRAFEAKRKYDAYGIDQVEILPADQQNVTIRVSPSTYLGAGFALGGASAKAFASVAKVVLKRGTEITQPVRTDSFDVTFSNAYGKKETYKGGTFAFPLTAFDPAKVSINVIIIPEGGNVGDEAVKTLSIDDLRKLE